MTLEVFLGMRKKEIVGRIKNGDLNEKVDSCDKKFKLFTYILFSRWIIHSKLSLLKTSIMKEVKKNQKTRYKIATFKKVPKKRQRKNKRIQKKSI